MSGREEGYVFSKLVRSASAVAQTAGKPGYSLTNWVSDLGTTCQQVSRVSFVSCVFTNTAYNVNGSSSTDPNNLASYNVAGLLQSTVSVTEGFYNVTQLMSAIVAAINPELAIYGFGESIALSQDPISQKVLLTYTPGTSGHAYFKITANTSSPSTGSLWTLLGFTLNQQGIAILAPSLPRLTGLRQVYLVSRALAPTNQIDEKGDFQNVCINIPVTAPFGSVNVWECRVDSLCQVSYKTSRNLQQVDFQLQDEDGSIVNLNGSSVKVEFKVWFNKAS